MHMKRVGNGAPDFELAADASSRLLPTLPLLIFCFGSEAAEMIETVRRPMSAL